MSRSRRPWPRSSSRPPPQRPRQAPRHLDACAGNALNSACPVKIGGRSDRHIRSHLRACRPARIDCRGAPNDGYRATASRRWRRPPRVRWLDGQSGLAVDVGRRSQRDNRSGLPARVLVLTGVERCRTGGVSRARAPRPVAGPVSRWVLAAPERSSRGRRTARDVSSSVHVLGRTRCALACGSAARDQCGVSPGRLSPRLDRHAAGRFPTRAGMPRHRKQARPCQPSSASQTR